MSRHILLRSTQERMHYSAGNAGKIHGNEKKCTHPDQVEELVESRIPDPGAAMGQQRVFSQTTGPDYGPSGGVRTAFRSHSVDRLWRSLSCSCRGRHRRLYWSCRRAPPARGCRRELRSESSECDSYKGSRGIPPTRGRGQYTSRQLGGASVQLLKMTPLVGRFGL